MGSSSVFHRFTTPCSERANLISAVRSLAYCMVALGRVAIAAAHQPPQRRRLSSLADHVSRGAHFFTVTFLEDQTDSAASWPLTHERPSDFAIHPRHFPWPTSNRCTSASGPAAARGIALCPSAQTRDVAESSCLRLHYKSRAPKGNSFCMSARSHGGSGSP
jgi:hypothetical protein